MTSLFKRLFRHSTGQNLSMPSHATRDASRFNGTAAQTGGPTTIRHPRFSLAAAGLAGLLTLLPAPESLAASAIVAIHDDSGRVNLAWTYGAGKREDAVAAVMKTCRSTLRHMRTRGSCEILAHHAGPGYIAIVLTGSGHDPGFGYAFAGDRQEAIRRARSRCISRGNEARCQEESGHVFWDGGPAHLAEPGFPSRAALEASQT